MKSKRLLFIPLIFISGLLLSQPLSLSLSSTENINCEGIGCEYEGPTILINEVMLRPSICNGSIYSEDNMSTQQGEWIELYNPELCESIDISCYFLGNSTYDSDGQYSAGFVLPEGTVVPPRGFVIVRGRNAPHVPPALLVANGGNTIEITVDNQYFVCLDGGNRLWFPDAGGWFAFYDNNGVPQDAISWSSVQTPGVEACNPGPVNGCSYSGTLMSYVSIPETNKKYISSTDPTENMTFRRFPDGGVWQYNSPASPTYGTCNTICNPEVVVTCSGTATANTTGGTAPYTFLWSDGQVQTTQTAIGLCAGHYCVTVTDNLGSTAASCVDIYNNEIVVDALTTTATICAGQNVVLNVSSSEGQSPYSATWSGPAGFTGNVTNPQISNAQTNQSGNYTVTVTDFYGCSATDIVAITVNPKPAPGAFNNGPLCTGEDIYLSTQSFNSYSWSGPSGFNSGSQNPVLSNVQSFQSGLYTVTVSNQYSCTASASTIVELMPSTNLSISGETIYCQGETIQLNGSPGGLVQYTWTGPAGYNSNIQNVVITNAQVSMSGTYSLSASSGNECPGNGTYTITVYPQVDASISPIPDMCTSDPVYELTAASMGGTWTGEGVVQNFFNPNIAGQGTHTISYSVSNPACSDSDQTSVIVFGTIDIINYSDNICNDTYTEYTVSFDVVDDQNNPVGFYVNFGTGFQFYNGSFTHNFLSQTQYEIFVADEFYACSEYHFQGYRDCGCFTSAGTMTSVTPVSLCYGECSETVQHNGNQSLDADDTFGFALHTGGFPVNIIALNSTPEFCFDLISGLNFGQTYYISAIAGNEISPGLPDVNDPCFSISQGTPVVWYDNPISFINTLDFSVCGLEASFSSVPTPSGMVAMWSSTQVFIPVQGTSVYSDNINVLVTAYGNYDFVRTIYNNGCFGTDTIHVSFISTPSAYAGEDFLVCGYNAELNAELSMSGSIGQWSGPGSFSDPMLPNTEVNINPPPGTYQFTWRETNLNCWAEDNILVTFINVPNPVIVPLRDSVCGNNYYLEVNNVQGIGLWSAYNNDILLAPAPNYLSGSANPNTQVVVPNYQGYYSEIEFVWTETFQISGIECTSAANQTIVFAREPIASVGASNEREICGNCISFSADTTGSGWATGLWIPQNVYGQWTEGTASDPNATFCINENGAFGDTAHLRSPFLWTMRNFGCTSIDTMWVTFYERPVANAGLDDAICGNFYNLGAVYDITENSSYSPNGVWSVYSRPDIGAYADIEFPLADSTSVSVSLTGIWEFVFRENNSLYNGCYSTDTVRIEFVERPVISAGEDRDICGNCVVLNATSSNYFGSWLPNGAIFTDYSNPNTQACINIPGPITFTWLESNHANTSSLACTAMDEVIITFWRVPTANILTDEADSTVCGLTFYNLRAENPGTGISGYWYSTNPAADFIPNEFNVSADVTMPSYGYHDYYWIEETGPGLTPGFCNDTAGPLTIRFIEVPTANAGHDTLFCGYCGNLNAVPSIGNGVWSTPSMGNITFSNGALHNTQVCSTVLNADNPTDPFFRLIWTEDNSNNCTDKDTMLVKFARIPSSAMQIIPPKCFGEPATINAAEDTLQQYTWNFYSGLIDSTSPANLQGGFPEHFIFWNNNALEHRVSLMTTNHWGCQSPINIDTIVEPLVPEFDITIVKDTCALGKGGIVFNDTSVSNAFFWINPNVGPPVGTPLTTVYNLPAGEYGIRTSYITPNYLHYAYYITTFGTPYCLDTIYYDIETIGMIQAEISVSAEVLLETLVAPNASVIFLNTSDYDNISKRCEWHFDDESILKSCDEMVEHIYAEAGCYNPFLIVMNRDLPECRDTAYLEACVFIDNASKLEIPNVFSPNADGINDFFQVKAQTLRTFSGMIVNRWGRIVYEWTNWEDYEAGWDGKLSGGTAASPGVYFYIIKAEGLDETPYDEHGALHLMRE